MSHLSRSLSLSSWETQLQDQWELLRQKTRFPEDFCQTAYQARLTTSLQTYRRPFIQRRYSPLLKLPFFQVYSIREHPQRAVEFFHSLSAETILCASCQLKSERIDSLISSKNNSLEQGLCQSCCSELLASLTPIRVGPWLYDQLWVRGEWQSFYKWDRLLPFLPPLKNTVIADIGSSNGYFLYSILQHAPQFVMGFDPQERFHFQFLFHQKLAFVPELHFEPLGLEALVQFPSFFNVIFCLGVLYHRKDPLTALKILRRALKSTGTLVLETLALPGEGPWVLAPPQTYMKARNTYWIPQIPALIGWLERAGFHSIQPVALSITESSEQQSSPWSKGHSLTDFLDAENPHLSLEKLPLAQRCSLIAHA